MRQRIQSILKALSAGAYEREEAIALSLLSALAGESIFMLGLPGVGKSMIARRLKLAFKDSSVFEYLMSRFSTPDEIFGPVSISKLKNEDCYERVVDGYLPSAEVVFLDEIWKAGPAIQNSLLTVLNERIYLNGNQELHLPVKAIIAASNELPAEGEGLEALWDRFLIRYIVEPIKQKTNFLRLISGAPQPSESSKIEITPLTDDDYGVIRRESETVVIPENISELLFTIRQLVNDMPKILIEDDDDDEEENKEKYYVSDRRWKKIVGILRTSAYLNSRKEVDMSDLLLLEFMLWDNDGVLPRLRKLLGELIAADFFADLLKIYKTLSIPKTAPRTGGKVLHSDDRVHYQILCDNYILKIRIDDYQTMLKSPKSFFFASETNDSHLILRESGQYSVRVPKAGYVCINSYNYPMVTSDGACLTNPTFVQVCKELETRLKKFWQSVDQNLFTSKSALRRPIHNLMDVYQKRFDLKTE